MRLWSLHPRYLDPAGLVALWRETLLAQKVLLGLTKGYRSHPQLRRFRKSPDPLLSIGCYLKEIANEAERRGYRFDTSKIAKLGECGKIPVTTGQIAHEWEHLLGKLKERAPVLYEVRREVLAPIPHPLFEVVPGGVEEWERVR
jgi:hypothetical protein